jgi:hypothetical protein
MADSRVIGLRVLAEASIRTPSLIGISVLHLSVSAVPTDSRLTA